TGRAVRGRAGGTPARRARRVSHRASWPQPRRRAGIHGVVERPLGRDAGLSLRMTLALAFLVLLYAGIAAGIYGLYRLVPSWWPYWIVLVVALGTALAGHYRSVERLLLGAVRAEIETSRGGQRLHEPVGRLAELAGGAWPRL